MRLSRIISGAIGVATLIGTVMLGVNLLGMVPTAGVILAGYMGIGGIMIGSFCLFFAITGEWRPNQTGRKLKH